MHTNITHILAKFTLPAIVLLVGITGSSPCAGEEVAAAPRFKAIAFDAFPIFDPRPIAQRAEECYPGKGQKLMNAWRTRLFEYQWLRALGGNYADFMTAAEDSLVFATSQLRLDLSEAAKEKLLGAFMSLTPWPDTPAAVEALRKAGVRLVFLSNMTETMLRNGLKNAGLEDTFEQILSTDRVKSYKPSPEAYRLGVEALELDREDILFVAFAGWDVAGAKWFGYPTFWVNRLGSPPEQLDAQADATGVDLNALVRFVLAPTNKTAAPR